MRIGKILFTGLVAVSMASPALAAGERAVRPSVKAVSAAPDAQQRSLTVRQSARAGAKVEGENQLFLAAFPLLALAAAAVVAVVVTAVVVADDDEASPA